MQVWPGNPTSAADLPDYISLFYHRTWRYCNFAQVVEHGHHILPVIDEDCFTVEIIITGDQYHPSCRRMNCCAGRCCDVDAAVWAPWLLVKEAAQTKGAAVSPLHRLYKSKFQRRAAGPCGQCLNDNFSFGNDPVQLFFVGRDPFFILDGNVLSWIFFPLDIKKVAMTLPLGIKPYDAVLSGF